jgi:hypothetical protein
MCRSERVSGRFAARDSERADVADTREPAEVIFGESLCAAMSTEPAGWISGSLRGRPGTVGSLVPDLFETTLRLRAPDPTPHGWWELYRNLFDVVASVGADTSTPTEAWFAIWEGHGFVPSTTQLGWRKPPADDAEHQWREERREQQRQYDRERAETIGPALAAVPRFELPGRVYYLVTGALSAVSNLRYPGDDDWRNPDLFWPNDRSWFAATDVDFWSLYVGGPESFTSELVSRAPTSCEFVDHSDFLPIED